MDVFTLPRRRRGLAVVAALALAGLLPGTLQPAAADRNEGATPTTQDDGRRISGGGLHTCAVLDTGEVQCWGQNDNGQLGNDSVATTTVPKKVFGITTALAVTGGATHSCALIHDGTVQCWGNNGSGQLGNGRTSPPDPPMLKPVPVSGLSDATAISAGGFHTCALRAGGTVACWGHDGSGQLGNGGTLGTSYEPVVVQVDTDADLAVETLAPLAGATAVTSGEYHSCAVIGGTGEVRCWGHNGFGQLGNGITLPGTHSTTAVPVSGLPDDGHKAVAITAGESHTCAVLDDNTVRCWGHNFFGQLGNDSSGDGTDSSTPVKAKTDADGTGPGGVADLGAVVAVTAGQFHTCALVSGGSVRCWGQNGRGQLGDNSTTDRKAAFPVPGVSGVRAVTAGGFHTCALVGTAMKCWGYNFYGQLGAFESSNRTPVAVTALAAATVVTVGDGHACGLVTSTAVPPTDQPVCWGNNASGELGADLTPSPANSTIPVDVAGIGDAGNVGLDPPELVDPISSGNQFSCALPAGSTTPKCWGRGVNGELGNGSNASSDVPVAVSGLSNVTQVAAGGERIGTSELGHACARLADGTVRCWGDNSAGQLGDETTTDRSTPVVVRSDHDDDHLNTPEPPITPPTNLTGATAVAVGGTHSCALMSDTRVRCWGNNDDGQLGDGTRDDATYDDWHYAVTVDTDPEEPDPDEDEDKHFVPLTGVVEIAAGSGHTCARKSDHTVWCWGRNSSGQLGNNTFTRSDVPVKVADLGLALQPVQITAGDNHTCARVKEPRPPGSGHTFVRCWGNNGFGQIGDGSLINRPRPVAPSRLDEPGEGTDIEVVKGISAGRRNTCAVIIETSVWCWGDNQFGQIGDGVGPIAKVAVDVDNLSSVGGNSIPTALDDAGTTAPGTPVTVTVLANDTDADVGDTLTVTGIADPPNRGSAVVNGGTTVTYTPNGDFCTADPTSNTDAFVYSVSDGTATVPADVTITVTCPNTAPDAIDDAATTAEEAAVDVAVLANDTDVNGDTVSVSAGSVTDPPNGTAALNPDGKTVKYTPDADFFGTDTFQYQASDGSADSLPATVTVTVTNVNDAPVAVDDSATTTEEHAVTFDVVANDTDTDGPSIAVKAVTDPPHGSAAVASPTTVTYTPAPGYCGPDGFSYTLSDGNKSDIASVSVHVNCTNDGPNAVDDAATTSEDTAKTIDVLANDTDPEGDSLTVASVVDPPHGTAVNNGTDITYTPDPDFCGADDFGYTATDGTDTDAALVVPVVVLCHNDPPVANDDTPTATEDTAVGIGVLANDTDVDGDGLAVSSVSDPANGTASLGSSNVVTYKADADFCGTDTFTYTATDTHGGFDDATVTVSVACVNDAPVVADVGRQSTPWGETLTVPLSSSDVDAGDSATFSLAGGPPGATVVGDSFEWTPTKSQVGAHTIVVRATDAGGAHDDEAFTVDVGKRATSVAYSGPGAGQYSDPTAPTATLVDFDGNPVGGVVVGFTIGTRGGSGMTDPTTGVASATVVLDGPIGPGTARTTFAGNDFYLPSSSTDPFTIDKELATTTFAGRHLATTSGATASVELAADVVEEADGAFGMGATTLQVTFTQVGGGVLCTAPVSGTSPGHGTATCTTAGLGLGSRAVVAKLSGAKYQGPVDVGAFAVAQVPSGSAAGGGRVGGADDFAFQAKPVRKAAPDGDAVHVRRTGGVAVVTATGTLTSLSKSCTGGKAKSCTAVLDGSPGSRWQVDLSDGTVTALSAGSALHVEAVDAAEPDGTGVDRYGVTLGAPDSYSLASAVLAAGNIRIPS